MDYFLPCCPVARKIRVGGEDGEMMKREGEREEIREIERMDR